MSTASTSPTPGRTSPAVIRAREAERTRLSRQVHDDLAQVLAALRLELDIARMDGASDREGQEALDRASELADRAVRTAQDLLTDLRPPVLDDLGLIPAVRAHLTDVRRRTGLGVVLTVEGSGHGWGASPEQRIAVFRVLQEALANAHRHAEASHVHVLLEATRTELLLEVRDDGIGFDPRQAQGQSRGLRDLRERVVALGGNLALRSTPEAGTSLILCIPRYRIDDAPE